jgi:FKBP-type peptidyl-prolyl cis-trans isomerase (trigger factor)
LIILKDRWKETDSINSVTKNIEFIPTPEDFEKWAGAHKKEKLVTGFRKGFAPNSLFREEWVKLNLDGLIKEMEEKYKKPVIQAFYSVEKFDDKQIKITYTIELEPEFQLPDYKKFKVIRYSTTVQDSDIKKEVKDWLEKAETGHAPVDRPAQMGDILKFTTRIKERGNEEFREEKTQTILGDRRGGYIAPEIEAKLVGKIKSDTIIHQAEQDGIEIHLEITIDEILGAKKLSAQEALNQHGFENEAQLYEQFKSLLPHETQNHSKYLLNEQVKFELLKEYFDVPISYVFEEQKKVQSQMLRQVHFQSHEDLDQVLKERMNTTKEEFERQSYLIAYRIIMLQFLMLKFANELDIQVTKEELSQRQALIKEQYERFSKNNRPNEKELSNVILHKLLEEKVLNYLIENGIIIEEKNVPVRELFGIKLFEEEGEAK